MRFLIVFFLSFPAIAETSKILCELEGTYSVTYKDIKKTYLSEGIELFKNLARQTQQSLFLLQRAKTNFAEEDWQKDRIYIVQYWEVDSDKETFKSLTHTLEPSPAWINPEAEWSATKSKTGITCSSFHGSSMKRIQFLQIIKLAPIEYLIHSTGSQVRGKCQEIFG